MASIQNSEEFYDIDVNGVTESINKFRILGLALTKLGLKTTGVDGFNYETLSATYSGDDPLPTEEELITQGTAAHIEDLSKAYKIDRRNAYPSIGEQLDMIFHAGLGGDEFQAAIQAVKDAHPKPE